MLLKGYPLEAKTAPKNWNQSVHISWARLASFCHLGVISDSLIVSNFNKLAAKKTLIILYTKKQLFAKFELIAISLIHLPILD